LQRKVAIFRWANGKIKKAHKGLKKANTGGNRYAALAEAKLLNRITESTNE
jgi:hypothetical protein